MDRLFRKKKIKEPAEVTHTIDQMDLTDIYRTFQPTIAEYMFFSSALTTSSIIGHI